MEIPILGNTGTLICGISLICCLVPLLLIMMVGRLTGGRLALLSFVLPALPAIWGMIMRMFGRGGSDDDLTEGFVGRVSDRRSDFSARIQAADQAFNAQAMPGQNDPYRAQGTGRPGMSNDPLAGPPPGSQGAFGGGGFKSSPPRDPRSRFSGRSGASRFGGDNFPDFPAPGDDSVRAPRGDDLLGPESLPGLHGRDFGRPGGPGRPHRDTRRKESNDDEIFGGMLDDDGDGFPDF